MDPIRLEALPPLARELADESLEWMEPFGDASLGLLRYPASHGHYAHFDAAKMLLHPVRESAWWATALLLRNRGDDAERAARILDAVIAQQFNEPGMPYHGTFSRAPEEAKPPGAGAVMWREYDPNWRQFIGTTFLVLLELLPDRLPRALVQKLEASVRLAVEGEVPGRFDAHYTNIAMMHAVLLVNAGARFGHDEWTARGVVLAREIDALFQRHGAFDEYNSPTYYGVDLYALRLWQLISPRPELAQWGAAMERDLWRDIAAYYHPALRNMCGPFDRAYGMDMTRHIAGLGLFFRLALPKELAPFPDTTRDFNHAHDFALAPLVAILGADVPAEALDLLRGPVSEHRVERRIDDARIATAFLGREWMWGTERGATICTSSQFHPVTAHWRQPDGGVGWLRLENRMFVDASAEASGVRVQVTNGADKQSLIWRFSNAPELSNATWMLPGMTVRVKGEPLAWTPEDSGRALIQEVPPNTRLMLELEFSPC